MNLREEELEIEAACNKYEVLQFLIDCGEEIVNDIPDLNYDICKVIMAFMLMQKRMKIEELVGRLYIKEKDINLILNQVELLIEADCIQYNEERDELITNYALSPEEEQTRLTYMYPLPMIIEPERVNDNHSTGYLTIKSSIICRNEPERDDYNLDHINRLNKVSLSINKSVLENCTNKNKNPPKTKQEIRNFNKFCDTQKNIAEAYLDKKFYLTHKYDKRGRYYPTGYYINYQGNDYGKALINFGEGEKVNS